ncbi:MAG: HAMP domain-containing protein, partial [Gemmatimonadetes bacterium]|nr:HAMP domain-containing protein [Gemmatimonadota bacterium]
SALVERMWEEGESEVRAYRVVEGVLYNVQATFLALAGRPIGTLTLGLPLGEREATTRGGVAGTELCFVADGGCVAATPGARGALRRSLVEAVADGGGARRVEVDGARWEVLAGDLDAERPGEVARALAVPLDPVLAPFDRISRTLALSGAMALLLAVVLGSVIARGLTRPVRDLMRATERVAGGDYDAEVEARGQDELGALARAFNQMTLGLRLKERYRGVLDKVVSRDVAEELIRNDDLVLGGENREVTVLFADIRDFTGLTEGMEPQGVIGLLNDCMEILSAAVEAEGAVVDKYVGDEIMAVFGAPVRLDEAPLRAVRAALQMQEGMEALNRSRRQRGEPSMELGVGISTGVAVAGNMGSHNRLNYTVLGETVNLAARICADAEPGEILVAEATARELEGRVPLRTLGERRFKGFSTDVQVYAVQPRAARGEPGHAPEGRRGSALASLLLAAAAALSIPAAAGAQEGGLPTLRDLGLGWISPSGRYQVDLSGRLDMELYLPSDSEPWLIPETDPFMAGRLRLFVDAFAGEHLYALAELRADRGEAPAAGDVEARLEQLLVRVGTADGRLALQLGRFASPFGAYAGRHHTTADPFVRPPLPYEWRTVICPCAEPGSVGAFLGWKDRPETFRRTGAPPIWGVPYPWGMLAMASWGPVDARAGWVNSAPSSAPPEWGWSGERLVQRGSAVAAAAAQVSPELRLGLSWDRGPYREGPERAALPGYVGRDTYIQELWGAELTWSRGPAVLRGEAFHDRWEVPNMTDDPVDISWYLEAQTDLAAGVWTAARVGAIHYGSLVDETGARRPWDYDVRRLQLSAGYRLVRNAGVTGEVAWTAMDGPLDPDDRLVSLQAWWGF